MSGRAAPPRPTPEQRRAAEPTRSVWVDANAGTGKTRVLTDRVLRLLLAGAPPSSVLCLTYTNAAAGEMLQRIGDKLASWATLDDAALGAEIDALEEAAPSRRRLARARRLHDDVLALPGGLAIMTVHSLGQHLLRRFPLEAGVSASFEVIDERTQAELLRDARETVLAHALDDPTVAADLAVLAGAGADATVLGAIDALVGRRLDWIAARDALGGLDGVSEALTALLGSDPARRADDLIRDACGDDAFDGVALTRTAARLDRASQKTRRDAADAIHAWLDCAPEARPARLAAYRAALTSKAKPGPGLVAKANLKLDALAAEDPASAVTIRAEVARLDALDAALRAQRTLARTGALLGVADRVLGAFERLKAQQAVLDFDDLLIKTKALLDRPGAGEWVRYKLDQSFTHILVDEAQDTNPLQWSIIERLLDEVFAGEGTRAAGSRTLFVVGDAKQSIYRFQGADPDASARVRRRVEQRAEAVGTPIDAVALTTSFRSSQAVLDVVDAMLAQPDVRARLGDAPPHRAFRTSRAGRVEVWPLMPAATAPATGDAWDVPPAPRHVERSERQLAKLLAAEIRRWLDEGVNLPGSGRPLQPGDVLVLLRRREPMQALLVRALKHERVPVMGADRLALTSHLAVADLIALGEAILLPENDFAFACALKSPLFGLDDDQLFRLAHGRAAGETLQERMRKAAASDTGLAPLWARFAVWQRLADFVPAYEFYLRVLGGEVATPAGEPGFCGRRACLERFGDEAADAIDAFVEQALLFERGHAATLQGFLHWLQLGEATLKREAGPEADGVRVMTVHGAKGLEAPVVILADAGPRSAGRQQRLLWHETPTLPLWRPPREEVVEATTAALADEARAAEIDDLRLLYVAATRAAEWLVVCGTEARRGGVEGSWHARLRQAVETLDGSAAMPPAGLMGDRLSHATGLAEPAAPASAAAAPSAPAPPWLWTRPARARRPARFRPSAAGGAADGGGGRGEERWRALALGTHVHALLERLPALAAAERGSVLDAYLASVTELDPALRERIRDQVERIMAAPELAPLFAPEAWAEQPLLGEIAGLRIAGQVDRMVRVDDELWIADFKTGRPPPAGGEPPAAYLRQLAAYAALAKPLFPDLAVVARLVWTETGEIHTLDEAALEAHMPSSLD